MLSDPEFIAEGGSSYENWISRFLIRDWHERDRASAAEVIRFVLNESCSPPWEPAEPETFRWKTFT